jgi:hydrogenase maturation factor HypF (carbamoyltransferase family)
MVIEHKLEFSSTSHHIKNFISKFIREVNIDGYTYMRDGNIFTVVDSDEDSIKNFFEYLSLNLPQSIFMGESTFRELDSMYRVESLSDKTKIDIGLCPKCSQNISDNITSIFTNCWHCGPNYTMKIKPKKLIYKDSQNQYFSR